VSAARAEPSSYFHSAAKGGDLVRQSLPWRNDRLQVISAVLLVLLTLGFTSQTARAADSLVMISVPEAMSTSDYQEKLDGSVKFYFGNTPHPEIVQTYGNFVTNKKTNGFAKSAGEACNHVLLSALIQLQDQAKSLGGNAVVNIKSYFKKNEVSHDQQVECYKGFLMAGVALKGDVVKVAGK
jgi:uncharacterized protein YbjQ (UPF0145 family)